MTFSIVDNPKPKRFIEGSGCQKLYQALRTLSDGKAMRVESRSGAVQILNLARRHGLNVTTRKCDGYYLAWTIAPIEARLEVIAINSFNDGLISEEEYSRLTNQKER